MTFNDEQVHYCFQPGQGRYIKLYTIYNSLYKGFV